MKIILPLTIMLALTIAACENHQQSKQKHQEAPNALQDKSVTDVSFYKRGGGNLLDDLYDDLAAKDPELKSLERKINELNSGKTDSIHSFEKFDGKNRTYYVAAISHIDEIKDSTLRAQMRKLITSSLEKYTTSISAHQSLLRDIDAKLIVLNNLHEAVKITRTLPLMETYQQNNLPATNSIQGYIHQLNSAIRMADTLAKK